MTREQENKIKRLLAVKSVSADMIEREGWPALHDLDAETADDVIGWLESLKPGAGLTQPTPPEADPPEQKKGNLLHERTFGVWTGRAFWQDGRVRVRLKRYAGGPGNEYERWWDATDEAEARQRAANLVDVALSNVGAIITTR